MYVGIIFAFPVFYSGNIRFSSHNVMLYEREARVAGRLWSSWLIILDLMRPLRGTLFPSVMASFGMARLSHKITTIT